MIWTMKRGHTSKVVENVVIRISLNEGFLTSEKLQNTWAQLFMKPLHM